MSSKYSHQRAAAYAMSDHIHQSVIQDRSTCQPIRRMSTANTQSGRLSAQDPRHCYETDQSYCSYADAQVRSCRLSQGKLLFTTDAEIIALTQLLNILHGFYNKPVIQYKQGSYNIIISYSIIVSIQ